VRLEALCRERNAERSRRTLVRIRGDLDSKPEPGPWIAAARTLSERLIISESSLYWDRRAAEIVVSFLRETGNNDLADVREQNPREFERRATQGHVDLWGEPDADENGDD